MRNLLHMSIVRLGRYVSSSGVCCYCVVAHCGLSLYAFADIRNLPHQQQLGVAYSLCTTGSSLSHSGLFDLVRSRVASLAPQSWTVSSRITLNVQFHESLTAINYSDDQALKTLAYYHANGDQYAFRIPYFIQYPDSPKGTTPWSSTSSRRSRRP